MNREIEILWIIYRGDCKGENDIWKKQFLPLVLKCSTIWRVCKLLNVPNCNFVRALHQKGIMFIWLLGRR